MIIDKISDELLKKISDLEKLPQGSFNIRKNGKLFKRNSDSDIEIKSKKDKDGIDIIVKKGIKNKSVHIPVILTAGGFSDLVYNDFYIGEDADVTIVAGCGIHNDSEQKSEHNGIHSFHLGKNSKVTYIEKHFSFGKGVGNLNPVTNIEMKENSTFKMLTSQLGGVNSAERTTNCVVGKNATLIIDEKILTTSSQTAKTNFTVNLNKENAKVEVLSRAVAKNKSYQSFTSNIIGNSKCFGHVECDGIISEHSVIESTPKITARNLNANLSHEASIGKISEEQLVKLMTLGLTQKEAEKKIIDGFLK